MSAPDNSVEHHHECPVCGYQMDRAACTTSAHKHRPRAGDVFVCLKCGEVSVFSTSLQPIRPSPAVHRRLLADPDVTRVLFARAKVFAEHPSFTISPKGDSITCHRCNQTSYNRNDVVARYCGHCHIFHDNL